MFSLMSDDSRAAIRKAIDYARREMLSGDTSNSIIFKASEILVGVSDIVEVDDILSDLNDKILTVRKFDGLSFSSINSYHFLEISDNSVSPQEYIQYAVSLLYLYLVEYQFRVNQSFGISFYREFYVFCNSVESVRTGFFDGCRHVFKIADNIGYWVCRDEFHSEHALAVVKAVKISDIEQVSYFIQTKDDAIQKINDWENSCQSKIAIVEELQRKLDDQKTAFNFVGLYKGFEGLKGEKVADLKKINREYYGLGASMVAIPVCELLWIFFHFESINAGSGALAVLGLSTISLIVMLFYFLRVCLADVKSLKSQIMQIELRMTLCQFIQNYADTSKELKEKNKEGFEKFESLIFSSIVSSDEKIPSTFDGMDQLTNLLKAFQK